MRLTRAPRHAHLPANTLTNTLVVAESGSFLFGYLGALRTRFRKPDRDGLLAAGYFAASSAFAGEKCASLLSTNCARHRLARRFAVLAASRFFSRGGTFLGCHFALPWSEKH